MVQLDSSVRALGPESDREAERFQISLGNFDGPFDLLLTLIGRREMDITEIALSAVTDEFIAYVADLEGFAELEASSEFVVMAATLLDMKIVGLLPKGEFADPEDVALLEARDLLFARLLQYRAFRDVSNWLVERFEKEDLRHLREVGPESKHRVSESRFRLSASPEQIWELADKAFSARIAPLIDTSHLHAPMVSIREQAAHVVALLKSKGSASFQTIIGGVSERPVIVARFLAILELFCQSLITFQQVRPLGELTLQWIGKDIDEEHLASFGRGWGGEEYGAN